MYFNIKCIGKLPGPTNEFERSLVFESGEFERPKFDCILKPSSNRSLFKLIIPNQTLIKLNDFCPYMCILMGKRLAVFLNSFHLLQSFLG